MNNLFLTLQTENQSDTEFWFTRNEKVAKSKLQEDELGDIEKNLTIAAFYNGLMNTNYTNQYRELNKSFDELQKHLNMISSNQKTQEMLKIKQKPLAKVYQQNSNRKNLLQL